MEMNLANFREFVREADQLIDPATVRVALDLGSRDGEVALYLREHYPHADIYAFECNPEAITLVRKNVQGVPGVTLVERAVSDVNGTLDFFAIDPDATITPHADGNIGASSLYQANPDYPYENYAQRKISVESIRLEDWAAEQGIPAIDVIWMDLQGAELRAMQGLGRLLRQVQVLYTEVEYRQVYLNQPLAGELRRFLARHGLGLQKQMNVGDWFGDELYCPMGLSAKWRLWRDNLTRAGRSLAHRARHLPLQVSRCVSAQLTGTVHS